MRVDLGAEVRSSDGQVVGKIKHLIMEPETNNIRSVVIEKGFLLTDDVEVELARLHYGVDERIELNCTKDEYDHMPRFDPSRYSDVPPTNVVMAGVTPVGVLWGAQASLPGSPAGSGAYPVMLAGEASENDPEVTQEPVIASDQQSMPVVIEKGSAVVSSDGQQVGEVHEVAFDVSTGRPMQLVVRSGLIVHHDSQIPAELIQVVSDGKVHLNVTLDEFKRHYSEPMHPAA